MGTSASGPAKTWSHLLQSRLRQEHPEQEIFVINTAVGGFVSLQERLLLELAVLPRRPDLVIHLTSFNDLALPLRNGIRPGDPYQTGLRYFQIYNNSLLRFVVEHSVVARRLYRDRIAAQIRARESTVLGDPDRSTRLGQDIASLFCDNVQRMSRRYGQEKTDYLLFFQPYNLGAGKLPEDLKHRRRKFYDKVRHQILNRLKSASASLPVLDLGPVFRSKQGGGCFTDEVHLNDLGQEILAETIYPTVHKAVGEILGKTVRSAEQDTSSG